MTPIARPTLEFLTAAEVDRIIGEACRVLETAGVMVENEEGRKLLEESGAVVAADRIKLPEPLVRKALETVPSRIVLFDRDGEPAMDLGERRVHFDPGSAAIHLLDSGTRRKRPATSADVVNLVRVVDALPHYAAQATALVADDVPAAIGDRYRIYLALLHGRKPVITGTFRKDGFAPMYRMLSAVRGGENELSRKPLAIFDCCVSPPLKWTDLTCQALIDCARAGIPATVLAMPLTGATSPVTLRETVVQHCAENLSGVVIHQLAAPGAPVIFGGAPSAFDMRRGTTPMGAIETMMLGVAYVQAGRSLGLPTHGYFGVSDAKAIDYQAGLESGVGAMLGALAGINVISGPGMLDYLLTQSLEKLVLDHEACGMALRAVRGIEDSGSEAVSLIGEVIRHGEFLSHDHTRQNWRRELGIASRLIDRESYGDWEAAGAATAEERARAEVERVLAKAKTSRVDDDVAKELEEIMMAEARGVGLEALP